MKSKKNFPKTLCLPVLLLATVSSCLIAQQSPEQRAHELVSKMTLDEKITQTINTSAAIPRLNVPAYDWWNEGLHGVARSGYATLFPQAIGLASTWDTDLLHEVATSISVEARAKYNEAIRNNVHSIYFGLSIWSPNINIFRDPRWGRGQETYGEDPFLTSRLGMSFVRGLQGEDPEHPRVIATPKHFAVHSGPESTRHSANIDPTPYDLWDTYLPAFRATIVDAKADSIMCAYNAVDGQPACASKLLLHDILRGEWGFKGFITSDCGAVDDFFEKKAHNYSADKATAAADGIKLGTDTNCGTTYLALGDAVKRGLISEKEIDTSLERLFAARYKLGLFDDPSQVAFAKIPFSEVRSAQHQETALKAARESMVLLQNRSNLLPLRASTKTIAVIGPNAAALSAIEGNYNAVPRNPQLPLDGIAAEFGATHVLYAQGSSYAEGVTLPAPRTLFHSNDGKEGITGEYFSNTDFSGTPTATRVDKEIDFDWNSAAPVDGLDQSKFSVRWSGTITPPQSGDYEFHARLAHCFPCYDSEKFAVYLDDVKVTSFASPAGKESRGSGSPRFNLHFADTQPHKLRVEYIHEAPLFGGGFTLEWVPPADVMRQQAVAIAKQSDVVLAFVGLSPEIEGEEMPLKVEGFAGGDRTDIKLPAAQQQLLEAVAATGKPIVVVLLNGSALAINWAQQHAAAILEAWYPGEAGARAIAETLSGKNNPGGRLPITFYTSKEQLPSFDDYSMSNRTYRYFKGTPLYGFGYGLSYTSFAYSNVKLSTSHLHAGDDLTVEADVTNTGHMAGDEVSQLYLLPPSTPLAPALELEAFQRIHLAPGEKRHLLFTLRPRQLSLVDAKGDRAVRAGEYRIAVGGSQPSSSAPSTSFAIEGSQPLPH
ncbi:glycoside hydrolase family 3 protein [Granulicella sp. WH15]|uniref:glycoside hydrolase family 3 C-terminal domain-containing protein n=1 Tax=Granulicella sp. WH15 TaxID=2602070 RepID=UPI001366D48A|nr:glycoside hydrolase family 3 C-terminal domain-containing protein [Granulicella sp. WH15]QHN03760.1 glycoside hydrolase family 3 protein [Granulicella sp. WH15]